MNDEQLVKPEEYSVYETIEDDRIENSMTDMDVFVAWRIGLQAYKSLRSMGVKLPHDAEEE